MSPIFQQLHTKGLLYTNITSFMPIILSIHIITSLIYLLTSLSLSVFTLQTISIFPFKRSMKRILFSPTYTMQYKKIFI